MDVVNILMNTPAKIFIVQFELLILSVAINVCSVSVF